MLFTSCAPYECLDCYLSTRSLLAIWLDRFTETCEGPLIYIYIYIYT